MNLNLYPIYLYKQILKKSFFVYKWRLQWLPSVGKHVHVYIYTKIKNNCETFLYPKSQTHCKNPDNFCSVFIYNKQDTFRYAIFMKILKLAFLYKKHDTLRYVTFLYTKILTPRQKQDNLHYIFLCKNPDIKKTQFLIKCLKLAEGGTFLFAKNNALCVKHWYAKNNALSVTVLYTKRLILSVTVL